MGVESSQNAFNDNAEAIENNWERAVADLAEDLIESGGLPREAAAHLVVRTLTEQPRSTVLDLLRVAARLRPKFEGSGTDWALELVEPVRGLRPEDDADDGCAIIAAADLDLAAAVVEFVLRCPGRHIREGASSFGAAGAVYRWRRIADPRLDKLVRERPQDLERIIACVSELDRSIEPCDADELWACLELDMMSRDDDWL